MAEVSNEDANDLADEILLREEFLPAREPGFFSRQVNRVIEAVSDVVSRIFEAIFGGSGGAAGRGIAFMLVALALLLLVFAIYKAITGRVPKVKEEQTAARVVFDEVVEPEQLRAEMTRHTTSGNWRQAVIAGFRLGVVGLIDGGIAREIAGATTGDFARAVHARKPELSPTYASAAQAFERAFYSDLEIDRTDMDAVDALLGALTTAGSR